jgi:hypothetical protein
MSPAGIMYRVLNWITRIEDLLYGHFQEQAAAAGRGVECYFNANLLILNVSKNFLLDQFFYLSTLSLQVRKSAAKLGFVGCLLNIVTVNLMLAGSRLMFHAAVLLLLTSMTLFK